MRLRRRNGDGRARASHRQRIVFASVVVVIGVELVAITERSSQQGASHSLNVGATIPASPTSRPDGPPQSATSSSVPATTTTSAATPPTSVVSAPGVITYTMAAPATVVVSTTKDTWTQVRAAKSSAVLSVGVLTAGQSKSYTSPIWIRFGDPSGVTATANGSPLNVPTTGGPVDLAVVNSGH